MFGNWQLAGISLGYIGLLFVIAYLGDKYRHKLVRKRQAIIYALTLGVYSTSWSFLGTTAQASDNFLSHVPINLGPILLFIFAWSFIQRIVRVSLKLNLTSIADLLAARFGKSRNLAIMVTIVALVGTMPYIALQLKAIVYAFGQLQTEKTFNNWQFGFLVSALLTGFTIMFGIRHIDVTERHPGVMLAIAFESLVKLFAFLAVGIFVSYVLFTSSSDLISNSQVTVNFQQQFNLENLLSTLAMLVISMAAFLSLPRQFQVMVVELNDEKDMRLSRRIFPLYLLVFMIFAVPLGIAGQLLLGDSVPSDTYVLYLPWSQGQAWLTLVTFLGAISAASSMVIISSIALSTMLSNEIVFPWLYRANEVQKRDYDSFRKYLLLIRKLLVTLVIFLGYGVFLMASPDTLSSLGEIAFGAFTQLTPALVAAFYWRRATLTAVYGGILIGFSAWLFLNFIPEFGLYAHPFTNSYMPATTKASLFALSVNIIAMWLLSYVSRQSVQERIQASLFVENPLTTKKQSQRLRAINVDELELLVSRFVGEEKAQNSFALFKKQFNKQDSEPHFFNQQLLQHTENTLASVMGASSARLVLSSALEGRDIALDEIAVLVEEASTQRQQFSQDLLHSAIENASEGISIVDKDLNLVAWNKKYLDIFDYPTELIYQGCPIRDLIYHNLQKELFSEHDVEQQVNKRLNYLRQGSPHSSEREYNDGRVIHIEGNPLPDGGFVMLFSDITRYRQIEKGLKEANVDLETRVQERTQKLAQTNEALAKAREKAEQAHLKKSLYLKACGHDLMQPLEAARLFTAALASHDNLTPAQQKQIENIDHSLKVANNLVADLAEVARIESGNIKPRLTVFSIKALFDDLTKEFSANAQELNVDFQLLADPSWIKSDRSLLRRILQNLIGNAFRYASPGKVIVQAKALDNCVEIAVIDNGPGIPTDKQQLVFEQFTQLSSQAGSSATGLGLGLSITQSLAQLLGHQLSLKSAENQGCTFTVCVEKTAAQAQAPSRQPAIQSGLTDACVLCIDNDENVLNAMVELLSAWDCSVLAANSYQQAQDVFQQHKNDIDILLVDYQLDNDFDGISLISSLRAQLNQYMPAILITATIDANLESKAETADIAFMKKIIKPAALRSLMSAMLTKRFQQKFME